MDWIECNKKLLVKNIKVDKNLISSLVKSSSKRLSSQALLELDDLTATSKISLTYEALRELLEALAVSKGFKIYNHECYTAFLKEKLSKFDLAKEFDTFRKIRNAINYYGKDLTTEEAKEILTNMLQIINKIKSLL